MLPGSPQLGPRHTFLHSDGFPVSSCPSVGHAHPCLLLSPQDSPEAGGEQEEEQAFLVSLYKFMKERHTPIERVPHLGFKQSASKGEGALGGVDKFRGTARGSLQARQQAKHSAPGDPGCCQPLGVACEDGASLKARGGVGFPSSWPSVCPIRNSGPAWEYGLAESDSLPCLFPSVNLWKIYKAVEKLGAYELVRKDSQVPCLCFSLSHTPPPQQELRSRAVGRAVLACRYKEDQNSQVQPMCRGMKDCALCIPKQVSSHPHLFHPPLLQNPLYPAVR